jgi:hypothetical protein
LFDRFFDRLPKEFIFEREMLRSRLWRSPERWQLAHEVVAHCVGLLAGAVGVTLGVAPTRLRTAPGPRPQAAAY